MGGRIGPCISRAHGIIVHRVIHTLRLIAACAILTLVGCDRADPLENATTLPPELQGPVEPPQATPPNLPDNAQSTATVGLIVYKDLPQAVGLRGRWRVNDADWFAVSGRRTTARSTADLAAVHDAIIAIDRDQARFTADKGRKLPVLNRCQSLAFIDKDRLVDAARAADPNRTTREDVLHGYGIAVAERDLLDRFNKSLSATGQAEVIAVDCDDPERDPEAGLLGAPGLIGVYRLQENKTVFLFENGIGALADRLPQ